MEAVVDVSAFYHHEETVGRHAFEMGHAGFGDDGESERAFYRVDCKRHVARVGTGFADEHYASRVGYLADAVAATHHFHALAFDFFDEAGGLAFFVEFGA